MLFEKEFYNNYKRDGFIHIRGFFKNHEPEACLELMSSMFDDHAGETLKDTLVSAMKCDSESYKSTLAAYARSRSVLSLFLGESIHNLLKKIGLCSVSIPTTPVVHISSDDLVLKGGYSGLAAHQDWPSIVGSLDSVIVWVPLTNVTELDKPLQVIRGSHIRGVLPGKAGSNGLWIKEEEISGNKFEDIICESNDLIIMSTFCVHRTRQDGPGFRVAASLRFNNLEDPTFQSNNFPCAYIRKVDRNLYRNMTPSRQQVEEIFKQ